MSKNSEHHDTYIIPPNFIEGSTLFGGMFKIRNVIEAGVLAAAVGVPVFSLDLSLTVRIIILCLTALPLALFALMGIAGEPLSSYIIAFSSGSRTAVWSVRRSRKRKGRSRNRKRKAACAGKRVDAIGDRRCYPQAVGKEKAYRGTPGGGNTETEEAAPQKQSGLALSQPRSGVSAD